MKWRRRRRRREAALSLAAELHCVSLADYKVE